MVHRQGPAYKHVHQAWPRSEPVRQRDETRQAVPRACRKHPLCLDNYLTRYRLPHVAAMPLYAKRVG
eukprot:5482946-Pleurochrysis_carterae.AAC.1